MMMAREFTKPVMTGWGTNVIKRPNLSAPINHCKIPVKIVAAYKYSIPCIATSGPINDAMAPVAAEIMPGRPPKNEMLTAITKDA